VLLPPQNVLHFAGLLAPEGLRVCAGGMHEEKIRPFRPRCDKENPYRTSVLLSLQTEFEVISEFSSSKIYHQSIKCEKSKKEERRISSKYLGH
jgi:hypothetical protein